MILNLPISMNTKFFNYINLNVISTSLHLIDIKINKHKTKVMRTINRTINN